ncbi:MAG: sigma 54-interacting transcriptional regulator [Polyangiaceae bacterium]
MQSAPSLRLDPLPDERVDAFRQERVDAAIVARDPVLARWMRASSLGVRARGRAEPEVVARADLGDRKARLDTLLGRPADEAWALVEDLVATPVMALLADGDGVIVRARSGRFANRAAEVRLLEGACWAEASRGTNAIGTALAEKRTVAVIGNAHFEDANAGLFCYSVPLFDAFGELIGVFDVTGDVRDDDPRLGVAARRVAASLEHVLDVSAYASAVPGGLRVLERMMERSATPAVLVEARGGVRFVNGSAASAFSLRPGASVDEVFGVGWETLAEEVVRGRGGARFETRSTRYALSFDPIVGDGGRVLATVVHFDRAPAAAPSARRLPGAFDRIAGSDDAIVRAKTVAARFAPTDVPILLLAETGTGKELFARAIHDASARAERPFVAINCGALSSSLLESELFGYGANAFTGARTGGSDGKVAAAEGGTLFLDEIGEMSPALQAMLLRVLEDGSYCRVGEASPRRANFRLVCATCRDLGAMIASGAFRSDLYYRIQGATLTLPPLRDRADRVELAEALLAELCTEGPPPRLSASARTHLERWTWPGNVRELKSALRYAIVMAEAGALHAEHFPVPLERPAPRDEPVSSRDAILKRAIEDALEKSGGNVSEAARKLGVSRGVVYRAQRKLT